MRVFVAGATGAVGRLLVPQLLEAGHHVTGTSRSDAGADRVRSQGADAVQVDVFDRHALHEALARTMPDAVIHQLTDLAGADGQATNRLRREGTRNLIDAAKDAGVAKIVVQSIAWVYAPGTGPADEEVPLDSAAAEPRAAMVDGIRTMEDTAGEMESAVALRYGVLYGPGTWYAPGGSVVAALGGDPDAPFLGSVAADDSVTSFVHVADAARAAVDALNWPSGPVNITDDEPARGRDWVPVLAAALHVTAPDSASGAPAWARGASNHLARARGWRPEYPSWRLGFTEMQP
ncbi:NAD(P)-dependent oxidoreductase [Streptomyces sp. NPDC007157]|uniref:NAD-dependent epimerase/dehydratase family protein n=1 Tax=Streptomyces sp. NPDC007157 TaxID=3154681 RepID=UPI0033D7958E